MSNNRRLHRTPATILSTGPLTWKVGLRNLWTRSYIALDQDIKRQVVSASSISYVWICTTLHDTHSNRGFQRASGKIDASKFSHKRLNLDTTLLTRSAASAHDIMRQLVCS